MKRRALFALALMASTLTVAPVATAAAPTAEQAVSVDLKLDADHGLGAHLESDDGEVTLQLFRKGRRVTYAVHGEASEAGLKARFGKLGLIEVAFRPTRTLSTREPPRECRGEPWVRREGFFVGTIEFNGERDFVRIAAQRAKGSMWIGSEWQCRRKGPVRLFGPSRRAAAGSRQAPEKDVASLVASGRHCRCGFAVFAARDRRGRGPTILYGVAGERREGMEIERIAFGRAAPAAFVFDHAAGTAIVRPPSPFSGHAIFERRAQGPDRWLSTIRVPLLGVAPLEVGGPGFRASLRREVPGD